MDIKASIPPAYVAWRAGTITRFLPSPQDGLKIPALNSVRLAYPILSDQRKTQHCKNL